VNLSLFSELETISASCSRYRRLH